MWHLFDILFFFFMSGLIFSHQFEGKKYFHFRLNSRPSDNNVPTLPFVVALAYFVIGGLAY